MSDENTNTTTTEELGIIDVESEKLKNINGFLSGTEDSPNNDLESIDCEFPYVTTASYAFAYCPKLTTVKGKYPKLTDASGMFKASGMSSFSTDDVQMPEVTNASFMLAESPSLNTVKLHLPKATNVTEIIGGNPDKQDKDTVTEADINMPVLGASDNATIKLPLKLITLKGYLPKVKTLSLNSRLQTIAPGSNFGSVTDGENLIKAAVSLITIGGADSPLDLSSVTTFKGCSFAGKTSLTTVYIKFAQVTNIDNLFSGCSKISNLGITGLSNVKSANNTFNGCTGMTNWTWETDMPALTSANGMFKGCTGLIGITSKMPNLAQARSMFEGCTGLQYAYLHLAVTKNGTEVASLVNGTRMFYDCTSLNGVWSSVKDGDKNKDIVLSALENGTSMFEGCTSQYFEKFYNKLANLVNAEAMFHRTAVKKFGDSAGQPVEMDKLVNGTRMFSGIDATKPNHFTDVYANAKALVDGEEMFAYNPGLGGYDSTGSNASFILKNSTDTTITGNENVTSVLNNGSGMFRDCGITKFNGSNVDLSGVVYGDNMFMGCSSLKSFEGNFYSLLAGHHIFHNCKLDNASLEYIANHINNLVECGWVQYTQEDGEETKKLLKEDQWKYKKWSATPATTISEGDEGGQSNITELPIPTESRAVFHVDYDPDVTYPQKVKFTKALKDKGWKVTSCEPLDTDIDLSITDANKSDGGESFTANITAWKEQRKVRYSMKITSITNETRDGKKVGVMHGSYSAPTSSGSGDAGTES